MASQDLQWLLTRSSSSYIVKQKGLGRVFSREPSNLKQIHSYTVSIASGRQDGGRNEEKGKMDMDRRLSLAGFVRGPVASATRGRCIGYNGRNCAKIQSAPLVG